MASVVVLPLSLCITFISYQFILMKNKRLYNIYFNLHTVSGIVISALLFLIFFSGAFALFKDEITVWEKGKTPQQELQNNVDFDRLISTIEEEGYQLTGRDIRIIMPDVKGQAYVILSDSQIEGIENSNDKKNYFLVDTDTYTLTDYYEFYSLGELLYRFHFFHQIPTYGIYIAGFVSLFFLFAIITGLLIHWRKLISDFFQFRPFKKLKLAWTDAHVYLSVIGLPFQLIFALTSSFLCMSALMLLPANFVFDGTQDELIENLRPMAKTYEIEELADQKILINGLFEKTIKKWDGFKAHQVYIRNFGAKNQILQVDGLIDESEYFIGYGRQTYHMLSGELIDIKQPDKFKHNENTELIVKSLHYGDFGGYPLKIIYFILALLTCFAIYSGVLLWYHSRLKKKINSQKLNFNKKVLKGFTAFMLSIIPITALSFIIAQLIPLSALHHRKDILYLTFFGGWILSSCIMLLFSVEKIINYIIWSTLILSIAIPIANGLHTNQWVWNSYKESNPSVFCIDAIWIFIALVTGLVLLYRNRINFNIKK